MEPILSFPSRTPKPEAAIEQPAASVTTTPTLPPRPGGLVEDTTLPYSTQHNGTGHNGAGRNGACRLRIFAPVGHAISAHHPAVIIATEQPEREGLSVTNGIEAIASGVCRTYGLNPRHTVLIEHYDDRERGTAAYLPGRVEGEKFSCVIFDEMNAGENGRGELSLRSPQWRTLTKHEVETLIGSALP